MPEAPALARALDQARDVGDHEPLAVATRHAEVRRERRERVVRDLGLRARSAATSSVDLPAFGSPTRPTSATVRSSSREAPLLAVLPGSAVRGTRLRAAASAAFPRPPRPPCATTARAPSPTRSARTPPRRRRRSRRGRARQVVARRRRPASRSARPPWPARWWGWSASQDRSWTPRDDLEDHRAARRRRSRRRARHAACTARSAATPSRCRPGRPRACTAHSSTNAIA